MIIAASLQQISPSTQVTEWLIVPQHRGLSDLLSCQAALSQIRSRINHSKGNFLVNNFKRIKETTGERKLRYGVFKKQSYWHLQNSWKPRLFNNALDLTAKAPVGAQRKCVVTGWRQDDVRCFLLDCLLFIVWSASLLPVQGSISQKSYDSS